MKLRLRRHTTRVLTGESARSWLEKHEPYKLREGVATAVALCSCGWHRAHLHGEAAERDAEAHRA